MLRSFVFLCKKREFSLVFQLKDVESDLGLPGPGDALLYGSSTRLDFGSRDRLALDPFSSEHGSLKRQIF